jgi:hypothetical protein
LFGTPLNLNPKCLVFSAFVVFIYWMPHPFHWQHDYIVAFLLACSAYVIMAWYDLIFDCNDHLRPTVLGWMWGWAKPESYQREFEELPLKYKKVVKLFDIGILILVGVGLIYPYLNYGNNMAKSTNRPRV